MKNRITAALATILAITMTIGMSAFAATECHDYNTATNITGTYSEVTFQTPKVWGEPAAANGAFLWTVPEGYIMLSYTPLAGINPLVITNDEIVAIPLTSLAAMALSATNIQIGMLPADNRNTCVITATGSVNNIPGTYTYALINSSTGVYSLQYFASAASGISRASDVTNVLNSISFNAQTGVAQVTTPQASTTTVTAATSANSSGSAHKYTMAERKALEKAFYAQYEQEEDAIYAKYPRYSKEREAALEEFYARWDILEDNFYRQFD